ncbi:Echinoderm microtubule-associated protein-like 6 [Rhizoctonia solani]|uniref:Echinoderm microtubule-associated protein-like 6 n=1 Tax=Rhizoctonia solani TaxID=456999 RepID=A0A0K6FTM4_9AGAM|nr:Echinoderm microtubule-associated protein-like 6 [Rhizoctonia solani]
MSHPNKFRKITSCVKSSPSRINEAKDGTQPGPSQVSPTPGTDTSRWAHLRAFVKALEQATRPLPPLKAAISELAGSLGMHDSLLRGRKEYETLHSELEELFQILQKHCVENVPPVITVTLEALCESVKDEINNIGQKKGKRKMRDYVQADQDIDAIMACYRRIQSHLQRILLNIDLSVWRIVDEVATDNRLARLSSSLSACYNSAQAIELKRNACTKGTRVDLLAQLARSSHPFRFALANVLEKDPDVHTRLPHIQFDSLVAQPLQEVKKSLSDILVVVIDALDECDNKETTSRILDILLTESSDLPVKFIVSSRPEPEIRDEMRKQNDQDNSRVVLHELDKDAVQADIQKYLRAALAPIDPTESQISKLADSAGVFFIYAATVVRYIGHNKFRQNPHARLASVLESSGRSENRDKEIDELYTTILRVALDDPNLEQEEREDRHQVLYTVICAQEPLTVTAMCGLLGMDNAERVRTALLPLWSVLHISGEAEIVTTLHASFPDYMFNPLRSKQYHCDQKLHNQVISRLCFSCLGKVRPQFNICGLKSSYIPDDKVEGLEEKIKSAISTELFYASRYWAVHLQSTPGTPDLIRQLDEFLQTQLLLWMEIMNLKKCASEMPQMLRRVEKWEAEYPTDLNALIHDAWRFASSFALGAAVDSTPHIYISMLPFWPELSPIAKCYKKRARGLIATKGTAIGRQEHALLATWPIDGCIRSHVFSPDGTQIAVAADRHVYLLSASTGRPLLSAFKAHQRYVEFVRFTSDGSRILSCSRHIDSYIIYVWSTQSGKIILGPLKEDSHSYFHRLQVAFSPDGTNVIFLSRPDFRSLPVIRIWDALGGEHTITPSGIDGRYITASSISCSSEKLCIAFGYQGGIMLYDFQGKWSRIALSGVPDNGYISIVELSPNGALVAGEHSGNIYVWELETGRGVIGPLSTGNRMMVESVSFSPDSAYLIATFPTTIRTQIWDVRNGNVVAASDLLKDHSHVISPSFSPDGAYIVYATFDRELCLLDAYSTHTMLDPLGGHRNPVKTVDFSPDGTRIISGSGNTACVWDIESGKMVLGPLETDLFKVRLTAFSPKGDHILFQRRSGVMLLDAQTGAVTLGPLQCRDDFPDAAFLPDGTCLAISETVRPSSFGPKCSYNKHRVRIIATDTGNTLHSIHLQDHRHSIHPVFSPDGTRLVLLSGFAVIRRDSYRLYVYEPQSGKLHDKKLCGNFYEPKLLPDSTRIISRFDDEVIVQDIVTGEKVVEHLRDYPDPSPVFGIKSTFTEFSSDCTRIALIEDEHTLHVWDAQNGQRVLGPVNWHSSHVSSMGLSSDFTRLVSGLRDGTLRVTDIQATHTPVCIYILNYPPLSLTVIYLQPSGSSPDDFGEWNLREDGWVVDESSKLLVWIPPSLRSSVMFPRTKVVISRSGHIRINFESAYIGESWAMCYRPI